MRTKIQIFSAVVFSIFVSIHLLNHALASLGPLTHIKLMNSLRLVYRNFYAEAFLLICAGIQIITGFTHLKCESKRQNSVLQKIHTWAGVYISVFLLIHLAAIFYGRKILNVDTNFYFGVAGLNSYPHNLFFIPYYFLSIMSFLAYVSSMPSMKILWSMIGLSPASQAKAILLLGFCTAFLLIVILTNYFSGFEIPPHLAPLIGK